MPRCRQWQHRFRENVSRWTLPREVILNLLSQSSKHMSAKELYAALYRFYPGIGLTTVYRTLELLFRLGFVQKVASGDGQSRYELKSEDRKDHHHHIICLKCGKIIDYRDFVKEELELVGKTTETLAKKHDFRILDHNIDFLGLCKNCR